ncbi:hypothetical protein CLF_104352, partial [Clonorchis sinensis]
GIRRRLVVHLTISPDFNKPPLAFQREEAAHVTIASLKITVVFCKTSYPSTVDAQMDLLVDSKITEKHLRASDSLLEYKSTKRRFPQITILEALLFVVYAGNPPIHSQVLVEFLRTPKNLEVPTLVHFKWMKASCIYERPLTDLVFTVEDIRQLLHKISPFCGYTVAAERQEQNRLGKLGCWMLAIIGDISKVLPNTWTSACYTTQPTSKHWISDKTIAFLEAWRQIPPEMVLKMLLHLIHSTGPQMPLVSETARAKNSAQISGKEEPLTCQLLPIRNAGLQQKGLSNLAIFQPSCFLRVACQLGTEKVLQLSDTILVFHDSTVALDSVYRLVLFNTQQCAPQICEHRALFWLRRQSQKEYAHILFLGHKIVNIVHCTTTGKIVRRQYSDVDRHFTLEFRMAHSVETQSACLQYFQLKNIIKVRLWEIQPVSRQHQINCKRMFVAKFTYLRKNVYGIRTLRCCLLNTSRTSAVRLIIAKSLDTAGIDERMSDNQSVLVTTEVRNQPISAEKRLLDACFQHKELVRIGRQKLDGFRISRLTRHADAVKDPICDDNNERSRYLNTQWKVYNICFKLMCSATLPVSTDIFQYRSIGNEFVKDEILRHRDADFSPLSVGRRLINQVDYLKYLGSIIAAKVQAHQETRTRVDTVRRAFMHLYTIQRKYSEISLRKKLRVYSGPSDVY